MNREIRQEYLKRYRAALTGRIWDQWLSLGVDGFSTTEWVPPWAIDPEALLLASSRLFPHDPRLRESVTSWVLCNGDFVSIARLKRIQKEFSFGDSAAMAELAATLLEINPNFLSWKGILAWQKTAMTRESKPHVRSLARRFSPANPSAIILKLRAVFGVTSRVEILFQLFHRKRSPVRKLARETAWSLQTVQKTLKEMVASGHVFSEKGDWPSTHYFLRQEDWKPFFPPQSEWGFSLDQFSLYRDLFRALDAFEKAAFSNNDEYATFILREFFAESIAPFTQFRDVIAPHEKGDGPSTIPAMIETYLGEIENSTNWPLGRNTEEPGPIRHGSY